MLAECARLANKVASRQNNNPIHPAALTDSFASICLLHLHSWPTQVAFR
jgi:hypothetical protein